MPGPGTIRPGYRQGIPGTIVRSCERGASLRDHGLQREQTGATVRASSISDEAVQAAQDGSRTGKESLDGDIAPHPAGIGVAAPSRPERDDVDPARLSGETLDDSTDARLSRDDSIGQARITGGRAGTSSAGRFLATSGALATLGVVAAGLILYGQPDVDVAYGVVLAAAGVLLLALPHDDSAVVPPIRWAPLGAALLFTGGCLPVAALLGGPLVPPVVLALGYLLFGVLWGSVLIVAQTNTSRGRVCARLLLDVPRPPGRSRLAARRATGARVGPRDGIARQRPDVAGTRSRPGAGHRSAGRIPLRLETIITGIVREVAPRVSPWVGYGSPRVYRWDDSGGAAQGTPQLPGPP